MSALGNEPGQLWARLAHKSISIFFYQREARAVDFLCFLRQKRAIERELNYRNRKWEGKDFEKV